jgi:flagellar motor switch protein FliM
MTNPRGDTPREGIAAGGARVQPFALGELSARPEGGIAGIERMGERLTRFLRAGIEPIARVKKQITAEPVRSLTFGAWLDELPTHTSLSHFRAPPLRNGTIISVDPDFVTQLVDSYYGGSGKPGRARAREFTPTEDRLLVKLTDAIAAAIREAWSDVAALEPVLAARETTTALASFVRRDEPIVVQPFSIVRAGGKPTTVTIAYTAAGLRQFESLFAAKVHGGGGDDDPEWRHRMAAALENVRLPVRSVLARPEMTLSQLMQLKPGDVIPIALPTKAPLIVADRRLAYGTIGEREGKAALMIEQVIGGE